MLENTTKKIDLAKNLSQALGYSNSFSKKLVEDLIDIFIKNIKTDDLNLKNIGRFKIVDKKERIGRNPRTKEEFIISSRKSIVFKPSKKILNYLDKSL